MDELSDLSAASLRRLARGLLYDRGRAEDVVQEAWLAAFGRPLASAELGGWLAGAVRRLARSARRDERRRQERELRAARPEAQPAASDVIARVEILRKLLDAVERLDEPYRNAIGLRFFDGLPPRAIAKRLGLPVNTVRTHVRRGLERLRRELDGERGRDRQGFLAVLAPFAGKAPWAVRLGLPVEPHVVSNWSGALLVKNKVLLRPGCRARDWDESSAAITGPPPSNCVAPGRSSRTSGESHVLPPSSERLK